MRTALAATLTATAVLTFAGCGGSGSQGADTIPATRATDRLEHQVKVAYAGAVNYATHNENYFARNEREQGELAAAISVALEHSAPGTGSGYASSESQLDLCSIYSPQATVRMRAEGDGDGIAIAAADDTAAVRLTYASGDSEPQIGDPVRCVPDRDS